MAALAFFPDFSATAKAGRVLITAETCSEMLVDYDTALGTEDETALIAKTTIDAVAEIDGRSYVFPYQAEFWRGSDGTPYAEFFECDCDVIDQNGYPVDMDTIDALESAAGPFGLLYVAMQNAVSRVTAQMKDDTIAFLDYKTEEERAA